MQDPHQKKRTGSAPSQASATLGMSAASLGQGSRPLDWRRWNSQFSASRTEPSITKTKPSTRLLTTTGGHRRPSAHEVGHDEPQDLQQTNREQ